MALPDAGEPFFDPSDGAIWKERVETWLNPKTKSLDVAIF